MQILAATQRRTHLDVFGVKQANKEKNQEKSETRTLGNRSTQITLTTVVLATARKNDVKSALRQGKFYSVRRVKGKRQ